MNSIIIKPGRERSIHHRHPWIFTGAVLKTTGEPTAGEIVHIRDYEGAFLAQAHYNPRSKICARILEFREDIIIDAAWWERMIRASIGRRMELSSETDAMRLVFGEADFLPGLIVDRYGSTLVLQALTAGVENIKGIIAGILHSILKLDDIYERSDAAIRALEGLPESSGPLMGRTPGDVIIKENGIMYSVEPAIGQKTGFFLDQRDNRKIASSYAAGKEILDCFCYSGGFTLSALKAGASSVVSIDSSAEALKLLEENLRINNIPEGICSIQRDDVFTCLRVFRDEGRLFDMVVLDPPKFAPSRQYRNRGMRAYKDINLLAMNILRPGGILVTFSCSGGISAADFRMTVSWAGTDALREVQIVQVLTQATDHPVLLSYPQSEYLKGLVCIVI